MREVPVAAGWMMNDDDLSHEAWFRMGEAFPADEPVARWITVLAMMSNDLLRLLGWMIGLRDEGDDRGVRMLLFRIQAALFQESWTFIDNSLRMWPEVKRFAESLDSDAQGDLRQVREACDENADGYVGDWIKDHRNVTFHYPRMHPAKAERGEDEVKSALEAAKDLTGTITARGVFGSVRFDFADEVVVQWLALVGEAGEERLAALREAVLALMRFVQRAADAYLGQLPTGAIRRTA